MESLKSIAKRHGITQKTLRAWRAEGIDPHDHAAMTRRAAEKSTSGVATTEGTLSQRARLRKLTAEAQLAEIRVAELQGKLISLEDQSNAFTAVGAAVRGALMRLKADLPMQLEGLSAAKMQSIIADHCEKILRDLSDENSTCWKS